MAYLLSQALRGRANRHPEKTAVWARGLSLTYQELEERSNQLANLLRQRGVKKGERIGLYFPKSVESVVSIFGVLKAGAVYVPLDPQQPPARSEYIIGNCALRGLITDQQRLGGLDPSALRSVEFSVMAGKLRDGADQPNVIPWDVLSDLPSCPSVVPGQVSTDLAYVLYTSGSTGKPKGVMISHQNALTFVDWCAATFQIRPEDRLSNHAPLHFDLSVFDIYNAIEAGATVYMVPQEVLPFPAGLASFIATRGISVWYSVPSALVYLILHGNLEARNLERLRLVLFAGEVFPIKYVRELAKLLPGAELYNLYGPTETNVCTYYGVDRTRLAIMDRLPIGKVCANTEVFAVNEHGELVTKPGETGELWVRGPSVTNGYWGDPQKTKQAVVPNPFQPHFEEKMYRTGDLVRLLEDGNYDFIGRRDTQIKTRGYRVELGEIETTLLGHPGVREAAAVAIPDSDIGARIKAFVAMHSGSALTPVDLQRHCASRIPNYMVPELIELRDSLPKTSTGKVDRMRLASEAGPGGRR